MQRRHKARPLLASAAVTAMSGAPVLITRPADGTSSDAARRTEMDVDGWGDLNRLEYIGSSLVGYTIIKTWQSRYSKAA